MNRLNIAISGQHPPSLEAFSALQGKSIPQCAPQQLLSGDADPAWQALKAELEKRISAGLSGQVSPRCVGAILEEELAAPESGRA